MLRKPPVPLTNVKLTLENTDERAEAPIFVGYYMLGRDQECQIRPKSSSIADRHCLLEHRGGMLRVFDLNSETGTFVNDEQLPPHKWRFLNNRDRLRCGKLEFCVSIAKLDEKPTRPSELSANDTDSTVLQNTLAEVPKSAANEEDQNEGDDFDIDAFTMFDGDGDGHQVAGKPITSKRQLLDMDSDIDESELEQDSDVASTAEKNNSDKSQKSRTKGPKSSLHIPKGKSYKTRKTRQQIFSNFDFSDTESLKMVGSIVLIVVALSALGYQFYQFSSPTAPRIISEEFVTP